MVNKRPKSFRLRDRQAREELALAREQAKGRRCELTVKEIWNHRGDKLETIRNEGARKNDDA